MSEETVEHDIGWAVNQLHAGVRVRRAGWNGKEMWLVLAQPTLPFYGYATVPFVCIKTTDHDMVPWTCSQADLLATDWELAE